MATKRPGDIKKTPEGYQVTFERIFPYDVMTVWDAITNPEKMAVWFMEVEIDPVPGGKMIMRFGDEDRTETYGRVVKIVPGKLFEYIWENSDGPDELASWQLYPEGPSGCRLVFTYSGLAEKYAVNVPAGWHVMLDDLEETLKGRQEPAPYDSNAPAQKIAVAKYAEIWNRKFSPVKLSAHYGTICKNGELYDIVFERLLPHPVKAVWQAITDPEKLSQWLGGPSEIELKPGGKMRIGLLMTTVEGRITRLEEERLLEYTWGGENLVRWELYETADHHCRLVFTETQVQYDYLSNAMPGWHGYLDFLALVLAGKKVPSFPVDAWPEIARTITAQYHSMLSD